ncbi:hypothetical protein M2158_000587 [Streptomyces sp. SAI-144]|nr:hypothetical protein [Streptomyces sp. SAI-144]MDH6492532.1 hypothetical protein [Streptomyces sp. SAI-127]
MEECGNLVDIFVFTYDASRAHESTWRRRRIKACASRNRALRPGRYGP